MQFAATQKCLVSLSHHGKLLSKNKWVCVHVHIYTHGEVEGETQLKTSCALFLCKPSSIPHPPPLMSYPPSPPSPVPPATNPPLHCKLPVSFLTHADGSNASPENTPARI